MWWQVHCITLCWQVSLCGCRCHCVTVWWLVSLYGSKFIVALCSGRFIVSLTVWWQISLFHFVVAGFIVSPSGDSCHRVTVWWQGSLCDCSGRFHYGFHSVVLAGFQKIGGYEALQEKYMDAIPSQRPSNTSSCGLPREDAFHIFRDPVSSDNPWPGLLLQSSLGCMWYWCCDQVIVQRSLAAKNLTHAKAGSIMAGYLKLTPLFFMIFPGMISRALFPGKSSLTTYCSSLIHWEKWRVLVWSKSHAICPSDLHLVMSDLRAFKIQDYYLIRETEYVAEHISHHSKQ